LAECRHDLPAPIHRGAEYEQAPSVWWDGCQHVLHALLQSIDRDAVRAIAIDGTSGTVLLTDGQGHPLTHALMYNDARASAQLTRLQRVAPADSPVNAVTAGLPKILWLFEQTHDLPVQHIMHQADWLSFQFSKHAGISDSNNCLKSGYDPLARAWPTWVSQLGIPLSCLPSVLAPGHVIGYIAADVARVFALPTNTVIVSGTTDSTAAIYATGANQVGDAVTSLGSTLVCKVISDKPVFAPKYGVYSQPFADHWLVGGASNSGGAVLRQYFSDTQMQQMSDRLQPEKSTGLNFYPLPSTGERFPVNDPALPPRLAPRPDDDVVFFQAMLEGIAQIEYNGYRLLHELGAPYPVSVRSVGGGANNRAWTQIRSRLLHTRMLDVEHHEAAYGSALLARQGFLHHKETTI
jgi:sugar (pentulose or hexulose) kinase